MVKIGEQADLSGFGVDDESIPSNTENRWDGQPRDSDGRFDKGSKGGKKFRISRKEKSSESPKKSDKGVEKSAESGIIKESNAPLKINVQLFAKIPEEKFTKYALDPIKQPDKARAFKEALGYTKDNYQHLIDNIKNHFDENLMVKKSDSKYGAKYELVMRLTGQNNKKANVCTGWIKENDNAEPRLTSAYVTEKRVTNSES